MLVVFCVVGGALSEGGPAILGGRRWEVLRDLFAQVDRLREVPAEKSFVFAADRGVRAADLAAQGGGFRCELVALGLVAGLLAFEVGAEVVGGGGVDLSGADNEVDVEGCDGVADAGAALEVFAGRGQLLVGLGEVGAGAFGCEVADVRAFAAFSVRGGPDEHSAGLGDGGGQVSYPSGEVRGAVRVAGAGGEREGAVHEVELVVDAEGEGAEDPCGADGDRVGAGLLGVGLPGEFVADGGVGGEGAGEGEVVGQVGRGSLGVVFVEVDVGEADGAVSADVVGAVGGDCHGAVVVEAGGEVDDVVGFVALADEDLACEVLADSAVGVGGDGDVSAAAVDGGL